MNTLIPIFLLGFCALCLIDLGKASVRAKDRLHLLTSGLLAVAVVVYVRAMLPVGAVTSWVWVAAVVVLFGVLGMTVHRWLTVPLLAPGTPVWHAILSPAWAVVLCVATGALVWTFV